MIHVSVYDAMGVRVGGTRHKRLVKPTPSKFSKFEIEEFLQRLLKTNDEGPGHPFHGNQYVEVAGQHVEVPTTGTTKEKLMHLFMQGHKFTNQELAALLNESVDSIRSRLSIMKKATPAGGLYLERSKSGHWSLQKKDGELGVPEAEKAAWAESKEWVTKTMNPEPMPPEEKAVEAAKIAVAIPAPLPPVAAPVAPVTEPTAAPKKHVDKIGVLVTPEAPAIKLSKETADAKYKDSLQAWADDLKEQGWTPTDMPGPHALHDLAETWKNQKASAMAQWFADTQGGIANPKINGVFKADEQLVKDVLGGMSLTEAQQAWKKNTKGEKTGTWPPPDPAVLAAQSAAIAAQQKAHFESVAAAQMAEAEAAKAKKAEQETALAEAYKEHAPHFEPVTDYVPDNHVGILKEDFGDPSIFRSQITKLKSALQDGHSDTVGNKIGVQKGLELELAYSKPFQALKAQYKAKGNYDALEAQLISEWAGSSGGSNYVSNASQLAIRDAFGMGHDDVYMGQLHRYNALGKDEDKTYMAAASQLGVKYETAAHKATFRAGLRDFVLAQYKNTQRHLKSKGIEHVYVARGSAGNVGIEASSDASHGVMKLQPASSFSANYSTARGGFSHGSAVYLVKVPASQVLSSYVTGYGCTNEHEVVVLAHPKTNAVRLPANSASDSLDAAVHHVKQTLTNAPTPSHEQLEAAFSKLTTAQKKAHEIGKTLAEAGVHKPVFPKHVGKMSNYTKGFVANAKEAAKKGDIAAFSAAKAQFEATKLQMGYKFPVATPYLEKLEKYTHEIAVYSEHAAKVKADMKAAKPKGKKKPAVHVHVHSGAQA